MSGSSSRGSVAAAAVFALLAGGVLLIGLPTGGNGWGELEGTLVESRRSGVRKERGGVVPQPISRRPPLVLFRAVKDQHKRVRLLRVAPSAFDAQPLPGGAIFFDLGGLE